MKTPSAPGAWDSPLSSVEKTSSYPSDTESATKTVRSYSDVVRASSPAHDKVSQETQITAAAVVETVVLADSNANKVDNLSIGHAVSETSSEDSESLKDQDGDDHLWTTVARTRNKRQETPSKREPEIHQAKKPDEGSR